MRLSSVVGLAQDSQRLPHGYRLVKFRHLFLCPDAVDAAGRETGSENPQVPVLAMKKLIGETSHFPRAIDQTGQDAS